MTEKTDYRIHIFGASGSGTSTIGKILAKKLKIPFFDFDDYYWYPTDPPFRKPRPAEEKFKMIVDDTQELSSFLISGHYAVNFRPLDDRLTHAVFLWVPAEIRQKRLRARERELFGDRILKGGDMHEEHEAFIKWAGNYDLNNDRGRNISKHMERIKLLKCPVVRIEGSKTVDEILKRLINVLTQEK